MTEAEVDEIICEAEAIRPRPEQGFVRKAERLGREVLRLRSVMERASMPGRDWLQGQLLLAKALSE